MTNYVYKLNDFCGLWVKCGIAECGK